MKVIRIHSLNTWRLCVQGLTAIRVVRKHSPHSMADCEVYQRLDELVVFVFLIELPT